MEELRVSKLLNWLIEAKRLVLEAVVEKKLVVEAFPLTKKLPATLNLSFGVVEPIPKNPLESIVKAAVVDVAKFVLGVAVAI